MLKSLPVLLLVAWASPLVAEIDPATVIARIESAEMKRGSAFEVERVALDAGLATVYLDRGWLFPAREIAGRAVEMVFVGEGRLELEPPDEIEAGQIELFTGRRRLDEPFESAVLAIANQEATSALFDRPEAEPDPEVRSTAETLFRDWKGGPEHKVLGIPGALLRTAFDDPLYEQFFLGVFDGERLGRFLYLFEPDAAEQVTVGQFVARDLSERDQRREQKRIHRQQRRGRLIGLDLADLGTWDMWLSSSVRGPGGEIRAGSGGLQPVHYRLDIDVTPRKGEIDAKAWIELRVSGRTRAARFRLNPDLVVRSASASDGSELVFHQVRDDLTVILPDTVDDGDALEIRLDYGGEVILEQGHDRYSLIGTTSWYPSTTWNGRASYDAVFHWPASLRLVASGRRTEYGLDDQRRRRARYVQDFPSSAFSFEIGDFERTTERMGHVEVIFVRHKMTTTDWLEETSLTLREALAYFESTFGPYPLDHLTVVDVERGYYQGLLGFLTMAGHERSIVAHELAHQWWGNLVGWASYRDQWISEAMANYSAKQFLRSRDDPEYSGGVADGWQNFLSDRNEEGRSVESHGPVVLGSRLSSSKNRRAYFDIVYRKGALVLEMLARTIGTERFLAALADAVAVIDNEPVSTADFIAHLERATGADLEWFAEQYVYGTGIPEVIYTLDPAQADDGRWELHGRATQSIAHPYRYRVVAIRGGAFDVARETLHDTAASRSFLVVPMQLSFEPEKKRRRKPKEAVRHLTGHIVLHGTASDFVVRGLPAKPERVWLDLDREVFGIFLDGTKYPKRAAWVEGRRLLGEGRPAEAETKLRESLDSPVGSEETLKKMSNKEIKEETRFIAALARQDLARIELDRGRLGSAEEHLDHAREAVPASRLRWAWARGGDLREDRRVLESRLEILRDEPGEALKILRRRVVDLDLLGTEAQLLLAIASRAVGSSDTLADALEEAGSRGVDVSLLEPAVD